MVPADAAQDLRGLSFPCLLRGQPEGGGCFSPSGQPLAAWQASLGPGCSLLVPQPALRFGGLAQEGR